MLRVGSVDRYAKRLRCSLSRREVAAHSNESPHIFKQHICIKCIVIDSITQLLDRPVHESEGCKGFLMPNVLFGDFV